MSLPSVIKTPRLLEILNADGAVVSRSTLWSLSCNDPLWVRCVVSRTGRTTLWSVQRLIDAGILLRPPEVPPAPIAGPSFTFSVEGKGKPYFF